MNLDLKVNIDLGGIFPGKTFLFGDIVLTTLDAFFFSLFAKRTITYRDIQFKETTGKYLFPSGNIASSFIVFDEVQMYQDEYYYTPRVLKRLLEILYKSGIPTLVMTATMPKKLEEEIFEHVDVIEVVGKEAERGSVHISLREIDLLSTIKQEALEVLNKNLIVFNTVSRAIEAYRILINMGIAKEYDIILLHSRLKYGTRREREKILDKSNKLILVSTQVVESGIDVDFDLVLTEVAPIDALIQRIGRAARRKGRKGRAIVFKAPDSKPYREEFVKRTWNILEEDVESINLALSNIDQTQSLLDKVYINIPMLPNKLIRFLERTEKAFEALSPLINYDYLKPNVRPHLYITILCLDDINKKYSLKELRDSSFNLSYRGTNIDNYPFLIHEDGQVKEVLIQKRDGSYVLELNPTDRVYPQRIYLINEIYYEKIMIGEKVIELGLNIRREMRG